MITSNLGNESTNGTVAGNAAEAVLGEHKSFLTVQDTLPPGVTPTDAFVEGGGTGLGGKTAQLSSFLQPLLAPPCAISGQSITCSYGVPVRPYEQVILAMTVQVSPGAGTAENEASISGGGAASASRREALAIQAPAEYGVEHYELTPEEEGGGIDTQAGSHPFQLTTTLIFNSQAVPVTPDSYGLLIPEIQPIAMAKDLRFNLPPGLIGNPTPIPKCSLSQFVRSAHGGPRCPNDTAVGVATPIVTGFDGNARVSLTLSEPLINLEPAVGEPARFGFITLAGPVILNTSVRTGGDYGVVVTVPNITEGTGFLGNIVTFWGVPADPRHDNSRGQECIQAVQSREQGQGESHAPGPEPSCPVEEQRQPFLIMPTSCTGPMHTSIETDSWLQPGVFDDPFDYTFANSQGETYEQDGCDHLSFEPSISVAPDGQEAATPTGLTVGVHVPQEAGLNPLGLAESTVRDTTVALPAGVDLNPGGADGLESCGLEQIALESGLEQSCPDAAKVGALEIHTPLLPHPLVGAAYLAQQDANPFGSLIALYLVAHDPYSGVIVKLSGQVTPDPVTGQLVSTFKDTPQLPFEDLELHFFGGSRAPLSTPALCGAYTTTASIAPWSGNAAVGSSSEFLITSGPNHTPCPNAPGDMSPSSLPFAPELAAGSLNLQAGAFTPFTTTMSREDDNQNLKALQVHLPPGLSGLLTGVELCPEPQASQGLCGPNSLIGETTVSVGLGGDPYTVKGGRVYLTGPYNGKSGCTPGSPGCVPFGLSIVNPAKAGPFDLENTKDNHPPCDCLVVRAKVEVDPITAAITVTSDTEGAYKIPTILEGIPLQIKHVNVTIDRPGFTFNPTNCEPMQITGTLTSAEGATTTLDEPFQVTNCATLAFKPGFTVSTNAHTSRTNGASLHVKLTYPKAPFGSQANVRSVKVELPKQLPSRLSTLQKACPAKTFETNPAGCPSPSIVGHAKAITPLIPVPLEGPAYFVSYGGAQFPELVIVLQGYGVTLDLHGETFIDEKTNITSSTFKAVPDAPVGSFELTLPSGPFSALAAPTGVCGKQLKMPTIFTAQNGAVIKQSTPIAVSGCKPAIAVLRHSVKGGKATIAVSVPSAGKLRASGAGLSSAGKKVAKAGTVTLHLSLSAAERRLLRKHPGRKLKIDVKIRFTPTHGKRLSTGVAVLVG